jgi:DNA repair protein RadA/Sms
MGNSRGVNLNVSIKGWSRNSNILKLNIPPELEKTAKTGIAWLDDAFGGEGVTPSSSILFTGGAGAGKTTLMIQLADALTGAGHIALFNTGEESLYQVRKVAKRIGAAHGFIAHDDIKVPKILEHCDELRKENPKKQLFLIGDSLQAMDDGFYNNGAINSMSQVRSTEMITQYCKDNWAISIIIGQVNKGGDFAGKMAIKHTVDVHAHLWIDSDKKSETWGERLFTVSKNRFGASGKTYVLGLDQSGLREKGRYEPEASKF